MRASATDRGVSPVVGIVLMVVITLLLAGVVGAFAMEVEMNRGTADGLVDGEVPTETGTEAATTESTPDANQGDLVVAENANAGESDVVHSAVVEVGDGVAGDEFDEITIEYPKEAVDLAMTAGDDMLTIGVDTNGDGRLETTFDEDDVSGVGTNDDNSELTLTLDVGDTLAEGDRVQIRYEHADNPDAAGEYDVAVTLNGAQTVEGVLVVE